MEDFGRQMEKWTAKVSKGVEESLREPIKGLFSSIITDTVVGNTDLWATKYPPTKYVGGRLRANWQMTEGSPATGVLELTDQGDETANKVATQLGSIDFKADFNLHLTNNLPYALPVEEGHSKQTPPGGFVRGNVIRYIDFMERRRIV